QPAWFGRYAVQSQEADPSSTLALYRSALALRRRLARGEDLAWVEDEPQVLHFARSGGWHCVTAFGDGPVALPAGQVLLASAPLEDGRLPADATAWVRMG
ncbi:MAG: DUF3459 domain-containing protein, partial [Oryzihumus sp.]